MKAARGIQALLLVLALAGCTIASSEPRNLDQLKADIRDYVNSGRYLHEVTAVAGRADAWIAERAARRAPGARLAVVFDLDETLLSNWPFLIREDLGGSDPAWDAWMETGKAPGLEPVCAVYRTARKLGLEVYFLTSRREYLRPATTANLRAIGCGEYAALIMKPESSQDTAAAFKTAQRERLTADGHVIIANLGDQESDLAGGFAERTFKLPDPFYFTP